jgi:RNA polymerase sigma-70 factor (ECF subfamily)
VASSDDKGVTDVAGERSRAFLALYDRALPEVYGYLLDRCRDVPTAEDLTSETFLAAVQALDAHDTPALSVAWMIGVARHKLADHWRRRARETRASAAMGVDDTTEDPWDAHLDQLRAHEVLCALGDHHRLALTLRYVDGLSVPECAALLERTVHATEALLVRARAAYRREYEEEARAE